MRVTVVRSRCYRHFVIVSQSPSRFHRLFTIFQENIFIIIPCLSNHETRGGDRRTGRNLAID